MQPPPSDLSRSEAIEAYLATAPDVVVVVFDPAWMIVEANAGFCRLTGVADPVGLPASDVLEPAGVQVLANPGKVLNEAVLAFLSRAGGAARISCRLFCLGDQILIIGARALVTENDALNQMAQLNNEMANLARALRREKRALEEAQAKIMVLQGILPICCYCKKIRDDDGYWNRLEQYITDNSESTFSHGVCPDCMEKALEE